MFDNEGSYKLSSSVLYPTGENPEQVDTDKLEDLVIKIREYIEQYSIFIFQHLSKSVIKEMTPK